LKKEKRNKKERFKKREVKRFESRGCAAGCITAKFFYMLK
jgi:hypothetical protein